MGTVLAVSIVVVTVVLIAAGVAAVWYFSRPEGPVDPD